MCNEKANFAASIDGCFVVIDDATLIENVPFGDEATKGHSLTFGIHRQEGLWNSHNTVHSYPAEGATERLRFANNASIVNDFLVILESIFAV